MHASGERAYSAEISCATLTPITRLVPILRGEVQGGNYIITRGAWPSNLLIPTYMRNYINRGEALGDGSQASAAAREFLDDPR